MTRMGVTSRRAWRVGLALSLSDTSTLSVSSQTPLCPLWNDAYDGNDGRPHEAIEVPRVALSH